MYFIQGVDNGVEDTIKESVSHLVDSVEGVTSLVGRLSLARRHLDGFITHSLPQPLRGDNHHELNNDFLSMEVCLLNN